jgi:hypothetical protein
MQPLGSIEYWFFAKGTRCTRPSTTSLWKRSAATPHYHDREYDWVEWFDLDAAIAKATYGQRARSCCAKRGDIG